MAMVEVILLKTVDSLGELGQVVRVSVGYARNYLIPNRIAAPSTPALMKQFEHRKRVVQAKIRQTRGHAEAIAAQINKVKIQFVRKVGEQGRLFGSVTSADIAAALAAKSIEIDRKQVILGNGPLKEVGNHKVEIRLFQDIKAQVLVEVKGEKASPAEEEAEKKSRVIPEGAPTGSAASATAS